MELMVLKICLSALQPLKKQKDDIRFKLEKARYITTATQSRMRDLKDQEYDIELEIAQLESCHRELSELPEEEDDFMGAGTGGDAVGAFGGVPQQQQQQQQQQQSPPQQQFQQHYGVQQMFPQQQYQTPRVGQQPAMGKGTAQSYAAGSTNGVQQQSSLPPQMQRQQSDPNTISSDMTVQVLQFLKNMSDRPQQQEQVVSSMMGCVQDQTFTSGCMGSGGGGQPQSGPSVAAPTTPPTTGIRTLTGLPVPRTPIGGTSTPSIPAAQASPMGWAAQPLLTPTGPAPTPAKDEPMEKPRNDQKPQRGPAPSPITPTEPWISGLTQEDPYLHGNAAPQTSVTETKMESPDKNSFTQECRRIDEMCAAAAAAGSGPASSSTPTARERAPVVSKINLVSQESEIRSPPSKAAK
eukprot:5986474-Pyramimonas_sp.AAC.1